jgi:hypothetical protein
MARYRFPAARQKAREAAAEVGRGVDPMAEERAARVARRVSEGDTFEAVARSYIKLYAQKETRERSWRETERLLKEPTKAFRGKRLADITRADIKSLFNRINERGSPVSANRTLSALSGFFNWVVGEVELIELAQEHWTVG